MDSQIEILSKKPKILTYNSTGMGIDKRKFIAELLDETKCDFLFLQETWLLNDSLYILNEIHDDYLAFGISGVQEKEGIMRGRPYGGVAILWHKSYNNYIERISTENLISKRVCGIWFDAPNVKFSLINAYPPCDNFLKNSVCDVFLDTLNDVGLLLEISNGYPVIFGGDLNVDFSRQNAHDLFLKQFMQENDLKNFWELNGAEPDYTFLDLTNQRFSRVDYFIVTSNLSTFIEKTYVHFNPCNPSKHQPIVLQFNENFNLIVNINKDINCSGKNVNKVAWYKIKESHINAYKNGLNQHINDLILGDGIKCNNPKCTDTNHINEIENTCEFLIKICHDMGNYVFPKCKQKKSLIGWNDSARNSKDECHFWGWLWKECGKPLTGIVYDIMKQTKGKYHLDVKRIKKSQKDLQFQKMAQAISKNESRNFWSEVKKLKGRVAPSIDGKTNNEDICKIFKNKYEKLYNSVPSNKSAMDQIKTINNDKIAISDVSYCNINVYDVNLAISKLKCDKQDGQNYLWSNHLQYASKPFIIVLSMLLKSMLTHGITPECISISNISSIVKDCKKDICDSENYRGIALSSPIDKLMDIIILEKYGHLIASSNHQYSYKKSHSTTLCTLIVKETIRYYWNNKSSVYSCFLDASKAFDRVRHDKLFIILMNRRLPAVIIRYLLYVYENQKLQTNWKGVFSSEFYIQNGVKQGGILSPILFTVYVDELLLKIVKNGDGCWVGPYFYGIFGYADDILLLCPTLRGLQRMLKVCEDFGKEYGMIYNLSKSICINFSHNSYFEPDIYLNDVKLKWKKSWPHLGNTLSFDLKDDADVRTKRGEFFGRVNNILANFINCSLEIKLKIFNAKCAHLYGTETWDLNSGISDIFYTAWNKSVRRLCNINYLSHTYLLKHLASVPHVKEQLYIRMVKLISMMRCNNNALIKFMAINNYENCDSIIGGNLNIICKYTGISKMNICDIISLKNKIYLLDGQEKIAKGNFLRELLVTRESRNFDTIIDGEFINYLIEDICMN